MRKTSLQKRTRPLAWDDLRCVLTVARTGSLSGAARALGVEHSTIFRRLNAVERRLGVKLFERTRKGYAPTVQGERAAAAASAMESQALAVEGLMLGQESNLTGVVRLATSELLAGYLLPTVIDGFRAAHPRLDLEIDVANHAVDLTRREADIALRASNSPGDHLIGRQIGELRYGVYGARHLAQAAGSKLDQLPWLGFDDSIAHHEIARWQHALRLNPAPRIRFNSIAPMVQAAAEGLGVAVLPMFAAERHAQLVRIGAVLDQPRVGLWTLSHREMRENARVQALSRHLARSIPQALAERQPSAPQRARPPADSVSRSSG
jgi:DNA-binding transcriptional LysR family regulator